MGRKRSAILKDFRGGWITDGSPDSLADNQLLLADNAALEEQGAIGNRAGTVPLCHQDICPSQAGMTNVQIKFASTASAVNDYYNSCIVVIIAGKGAGQKRTVSDYDGGTKTATINLAWTTQPDNTSVYQVIPCYNAEVETIIRWTRNDGTRIRLAIIGTTLCKVADDGIKTDVLAMDNATIGWFIFQDKFYFTCKVSSTDYYKVYDGTNVTDVTPNGAGDNNIAAIKRCRAFMWHTKSQRIMAALDSGDPSALHYSETADPTYFKTSSVLYPTTGDGPITGLRLFEESTLVAYQNSFWAWSGANPTTDATWRKLSVGQGTIAYNSMTLTPYSLTFLGLGGVISLNPGVLDYTVVLITGDELVRNITRNKVGQVIRQITNTSKTCAIFDTMNERYLLAYSDDSTSERNNKVLVFDWGLQAFVRYTGWQVNCFCQEETGEVLIGSNGYILKINQDNYKDWDVTTGNYKAISWGFKHKWADLGFSNYRKRLTDGYLATRQFKDYDSSIDFKVKADYSTAVNVVDVELDESFVWGDPWGEIWGWSDLITKRFYLDGSGNRIQAQLACDTLGERITVYAISYIFTLLRMKGGVENEPSN